MGRLLRNGSFLISMLFLAGTIPAYAQSGNDTTLAEVLARAYSMLKVNSPDAQRLFEQAVSMAPSNVMVRKQLGYVYHYNGRNDLAVEQLTFADRIEPSDTTKLQIAYWLKSLQRQKEAKAYFKKLSASKLPNIRQQASDELALIPPSRPSSWWYTKIYAAPYYDTRWETSFYQAYLQEGYYPTDDMVVSMYGFAAVSGDARSSGGLVPSIINDNSFMVGIGLKATPFTGFQVSVQQGLSFDLIDRPQRSSTRGDFRAVTVYGNGLYAPYTYHDDWRFPFHPFADFYSSLGYYSRYQNTIGTLQARAGVRPIEVSRTVVDVFVKGGLVRDSEKEYYNNMLEGAVGLRMTPNVNWGLYLMGEFQRGYYWEVGGPVPPYNRYFNSFRFFVIFDRTF